MQGFSIMQYLFLSFWTLLSSRSLGNPNYTQMASVTLGMLYNEPAQDKKRIERVRWLIENVEKDLCVPMSTIEVIVLFHITKGAGLNKEIDINGNTFKVIDLFKYLDNNLLEFVEIIIDISKKYSLDLPLNAVSTTAGVRY